MSNICSCGKGYASLYDNLCCFCREKTVSRAEAKKLGVRHRGAGLKLSQLYTETGKNRLLNTFVQTNHTEAELRMASHIRSQCPEFADRINKLRESSKVSLSTCKYCGSDILWSSENSFTIPLNHKDGSQHLCKLQNEPSPWGDGECPYCGGFDCECGE